MSEANEIQNLLRQGVEAAREGKKAEARQFFEQVIELDDKNEKAWFWLATVVTTDDERRVALSNVLLINPSNERAQSAMDKLQARERQQKADEEVIPGVSRRTLMTVAGIGGGIIVLLVIILLAITGGQAAQTAAATAAVVAVQQTGTQAILNADATATSIQETAIALASPTPTASNTPDRPTLPPEFTVTPTPTPGASPTPLPPPSGVSGVIAGWSGVDTALRRFLPVGVFPAAGGPFQPIGSETGRYPDISPDGARVLFTRFYQTTQDWGLEEVGLNGQQPRQVTQGLPVFKSQMGNYCQAVNLVVFVALPTDTTDVDFTGQREKAFQLYTLNLDTSELRRLTNDLAVYSFPAFSPDCSQIAVIKDDSIGANPGADIVLVDVATLVQTPVTNDLGRFVESGLKWSRDGSQIVYSAAAENEPGNGDIIVRSMNDVTGTPLVPIPDPDNADDLFPVFSPDARYIAFASNRLNGYYDIFVFDLVGQTLSQLSADAAEDYPGAWTP